MEEVLELKEIMGKVGFISVRGELKVKLITNQVMEMNLRLKVMKAKVYCIGVRVGLLIQTPPDKR